MTETDKRRETVLAYVRRRCRDAGFPEHELTDDELIDTARGPSFGPRVSMPDDVRHILQPYVRPGTVPGDNLWR